jgi:hypothetical protein
LKWALCGGVGKIFCKDEYNLKAMIFQCFIKTRVIVVYIVLIIISLIFFDKRGNIVIGLTCGSVFGILKYIGTSRLISNILLLGEKNFSLLKMFVKFLSTQTLTVLFMAVSISINKWSFLGVVAGILIIPLIILINSLTEALGLSHNNFQ